MKRALAVLAVLLFPPTNAKLQQHAPTVDTCRADAAVWGNAQTRTEYFNAETEKTRNGTPNRTPIAQLPVTEIHARQREMYDCQEVDPVRGNSYFDIGNFYYDVQADRWLAFIVRHNLREQFQREDAAGKR